MKNIFPILFILAGFTATAQSVQDAKQFIYNERFESASNTLHKVIANNNNDADAWYWLTQAYLLDDNTQKAADTVTKAPATVLSSPILKVAQGQLLLEQGKLEEARTYFDQAINNTKEKDANILAGVARAHIEAKQGDANYAIEVLQKAIKRDKKNANHYVLLGDAYRKLDNGTEAYKAYQEALDKDSKNAAALTQLGNIFVTQKNPDMYLKFFNDAVAADPNYAPVYYDLYLHHYYKEPQKAMEYLNQFISKTDPSPEHNYLVTDLLYLNKQYDEAIKNAQQLIAQNNAAEPRLYKLIAYSYQGLKDTATSLSYMQQYFAKAHDTMFVVKDFETMGDLYAKMEGKEDSAAHFYEKAVTVQKDSSALYDYYKKLANFYSEKKEYAAQAKWLGNYYTGNKKATNLDLFNWGIAHFRAQEYDYADSVFGTYIKEYPDQSFGYYWRARSNAAKDSALEKGTAIPHYVKLVEVAEKDTANETNKKWLIEAYGYLAAYETNVEKDYAAAIDYFKKLQVLDPDNKDAEKYISMLQKNLQDTGLKKSSGK